VAGAEPVKYPGIVFRTLIRVQYQQTDRGAGRPALEDPGEYLHLVGFAPLCGMSRFAGLAAIQVALQILFAKFHSRRTAIDDAAQRRTMTLSEAGDREQFAEAVS
jgi:hypothetical protein